MTITWDILLWILAAICFGIAAFGITPAKVNLIALGLLLATLTFIF